MISREAKAYLDSFLDNELHLDQLKRTSFKLERVRVLLEALGHPEEGLPIIHVAGSKGKGSTASLTASILQKAGYKVGLYTSPHMNHYRERIRVLSPQEALPGGVSLEGKINPKEELLTYGYLMETCPSGNVGRDIPTFLNQYPEEAGTSQFPLNNKTRKVGADNDSVSSLLRKSVRRQEHYLSEDIFPDMISEPELCAALEEIRPKIEEARQKKDMERTSFFELYTALALYYFCKRKVDLVVLETGLGGRLDATNAVFTRVCAITPISLEHTNILGNTLERIAQEKAAIIKDRQQKVVIGPQTAEAQGVIMRRCQEFHIRPVCVGKDISFEALSQNLSGQTFNVKTVRRTYGHLEMPLLGRHQLANASTAIGMAECLEELGFNLSVQAVRAGFRDIFWPGRFEVISQKPFIILDGAHNQSSSRELVHTLKEMFPEEVIVLILGVSNDKEWHLMGREFNQVADRIVMTKADHPRGKDFIEEEIEKMFPGKPYQKTNNFLEAFDQALQGVGNEDVIVVTGSLFLVAEARRFLLRNF